MPGSHRLDNGRMPLQPAHGRPERVTLAGRYAEIVPLAAEHADAIYAAVAGADEVWDYLAEGPFADRAAFGEYFARKVASLDPLFYTILDAVSKAPLGMFSLMRMDPANGCIEVGHVLYPPALQRTRAATEAQYLLARYVFDQLGNRRYEWKCNALNEPSRRAALRYGFTFEGVFRQHLIVKGKNRDTAWYSMLDSEWPARKAAFEAWLDPANFDAAGRQIKPLSR